MRALNIRVAQSHESKIFNEFLGSISMDLPEGRVRKNYSGQDPLSILSATRAAPVKGYIFESLAGGPPIGVATATEYSRSQLSRLGLACTSDRAFYLAELRIDPRADRRARVEWKRGYREWIERTPVPFLTVVFDENADAIRSFSKSREGITYRKIFSYSVFIIRGAYNPAAKTKPASIKDGEDGHWTLEKENGLTEVFELTPLKLSEFEGLLPIPQTAEVRPSALIIGLESEQASKFKTDLERREFSFIQLPATLYEVALAENASRIQRIAPQPVELPLDML